ncbi:hypothetical protein [Streptomyces glaucosporus]|uniref:hypothetical protein n=1 Tax=Streptomyces glaucosporus TaxID=284044 RepID=UPI0031DBBB9D
MTPAVVERLAEKRDAGGIADFEPPSATETTRDPRQSPTPRLRKLAEGQNAGGEKKAQCKAKAGNDLAPGTTWVDLLEDERPGEAAA